jgi:hypothetical protein
VIPTVIANAFYLPRHLLPRADTASPPGEGETALAAPAGRGAE